MANLTMEEWLNAAAEGGCGCAEVARAFHDVDRRIFTRWMTAGQLPSIKVLGRWWTTIDALRSFMASSAGELAEARRVTGAMRSIRGAAGKRKPARKSNMATEPAC